MRFRVDSVGAIAGAGTDHAIGRCRQWYAFSLTPFSADAEGGLRA